MQIAAAASPVDLVGVEGVVQLELIRAAVGPLAHQLRQGKEGSRQGQWAVKHVGPRHCRMHAGKGGPTHPTLSYTGSVQGPHHQRRAGHKVVQALDGDAVKGTHLQGEGARQLQVSVDWGGQVACAAHWEAKPLTHHTQAHPVTTHRPEPPVPAAPSSLPPTRLVVVGGVGKGEGQQALLLQVGLVDAGKRLDNHRARTQVARLQRGVLAGRALACSGEEGLGMGSEGGVAVLVKSAGQLQLMQHASLHHRQPATTTQPPTPPHRSSRRR